MVTKSLTSFKHIGSLEIGSIPHDVLLQQMKGIGVEVADWADEIFRQTEPLRNRCNVRVMALQLRRDLPKEGSGKTLRPFFEQAFEHGLCLCPTAVAAEALLKWPVGYIGEVRLAMKPVLCWASELGARQKNILSITDKKDDRQNTTRSTNGTPADLDEFADGGMTFLFCVRNTILRCAGFASLTA